MTEKKAPITDSDELRRRTEERLVAPTGTAHPPGIEGEPYRLSHELQVHQVELEMQNAELRQTRDQLETVLEQYSDLYEFAPVGYFILDRKGTIIRVNLTGSGLLGFERSRLNGRLFEQFVADAGRPAFASFLGKIFTSRVKGTCELALLNEETSPLIVQIEALADASGQQCRIALIDITKRKLADEAIRKVELAADEALRKVEYAADEALRKMEEAEEVPRKVKDAAKEASKKANDAINKASRKVAEAAKTAETLRRGTDITNEALEKVNKLAEVARQKVEYSAELAIQKVKKTAETLQKEKDASDILRQEKALAEAATRTKSQFLANMSHELRTPMSGILGMLDLVLSGKLETEQREFLGAAHTSALSMVRILNDILDLTKIEMGKFSIVVSPFSLRECVADTFNIFLPVAKSKGLDFTFNVADDVPQTLAGDQGRLNQVLTNLVGNALKFTKKGKVEIRVTTGGSAPGGKRDFTFTVADTGIGIPNDKKHLLFHTFSQVNESHSREYGGAGLGLAISMEIVERMGGTITSTSKEEVGSTFSFTIPLAEAIPESDALSVAEPQTTEAASPASEGERIRRLLLVEDDTTIREFLGQMLTNENYDVDFAEDGLKAVEIWEKGEYDLVLMDIQMPRINGFEATRAIREKERDRGFRTPIVAMTAHASEEDKQRCLDGVMDAFISKPINFEKTLQVIRQNFRQKSSDAS